MNEIFTAILTIGTIAIIIMFFLWLIVTLPFYLDHKKWLTMRKYHSFTFKEFKKEVKEYKVEYYTSNTLIYPELGGYPVVFTNYFERIKFRIWHMFEKRRNQKEVEESNKIKKAKPKKEYNLDIKDISKDSIDEISESLNFVLSEYDPELYLALIDDNCTNKEELIENLVSNKDFVSKCHSSGSLRPTKTTKVLLRQIMKQMFIKKETIS